MQLIAALAWLGCLAVAAWCGYELGARARERRRRRDRERREMRHAIGARPWWRRPPGDGPEGDY